ncbi:hypothetical protein KGM_213376 [Danaus plexippus plexippus]|uniref:Nucleolar protein 9 n=1 Tax=Danaus plexippus plexippus TaxID=278856 RepID=A0A212EJN9_DANPL|nr:hypothetical protein KGM_213376 [Danaus plexippus plexippus]
MGEESVDNNPLKKKQRRKRKNFLSNAKKYAKKGQMGRGTKIPEELYQYFVGILDVIKQGVENPEEREALVNNVLERTKGEELNVVGNQLGCRMVEILLPYSSAEDLERYIEVLSPELRPLCSDNISSHVVETLLRVACERATEHLQISDEEKVPKKKKKVEPKYKDDHIKKCNEFTLKICKYALNNLEDFVWDKYANHILRSAIKCLSGITLLPGEKPKVNMFRETVNQNKGIPPHLTELKYKEVPEEYKDIVKEFANRLSSWPQFKDLPNQNITSALLQVLLYAVKNVDANICKSLVNKLLNESFAPEDWVPTGEDEKKDQKDQKTVDNEADVASSDFDCISNQKGSNNLRALFVSTKKSYTQIYARCFINRLAKLCTMSMLNFTVQRLIDNCQIKEEFEPMFEELSSQFNSILSCGNTGVLVALAKGCLRVKAKQMQMMNMLETVLNCSEAEPKRFIIQCLRLVPLSDKTMDTTNYFIHVHGSVIVQTMLGFQRPAKLVSSILELSSEELVYILCDPKGCHIADAFTTQNLVGVKARDKMVWKLKGYYQNMAISQYGSRAFEQVFEAASMEQKVKIMKEMSDKSNLLNTTSYGRLIATKLDISTFKASQKKWEQSRTEKPE